MLTLKDLELVRCVADSGSLTAASRQMHISQSAVSQRLSSLHERLDIKLILRQNGTMQLTEAGDRVLLASRLVADELRATLCDLERLSNRRNTQLRIATQCFTCYRWLPFVISAMRRAFPSLVVDVVPEATANIVAALQKGEIDVAVVSNSDNELSYVTHTLFSDEFFAVMSSSHDYAGRGYIDARMLAGQTLILYTGKRHSIVEDVLAPANVAPFRVIQVRMTEAIIELARSGQGIAIIAGWALNDMDDIDGLVAVRITKKGFHRTWRAVVRDDVKEEHTVELVENIRRVGKAIKNQAWRKKLRQADTA